jgi:hypothetical protein
MKQTRSCWQRLAALVALGIAALLILGCGGVGTEPAASPTPVTPTSVPLPRLDGRRALLGVPDQCIDIEYRVRRRVLEDLGAIITVASWSTGASLGASGETLQPEAQLGDVHAADSDAVIFGWRPRQAD